MKKSFVTLIPYFSDSFLREFTKEMYWQMDES